MFITQRLGDIIACLPQSQFKDASFTPVAQKWVFITTRRGVDSFPNDMGQMKRDSTMTRLIALFLVSALTLAGCGDIGSSGTRQYKPSSSGTSKVQYRVLDSINALRTASSVGEVQLNASLTAAAATHSRDMSTQNRPWHFGSDGSSPLERVARSGYGGGLTGENISETYETEIETLGAWMSQDDTRAVILDPNAVDMGFAWFQEQNGKIWWTLVMGAPVAAPPLTN